MGKPGPVQTPITARIKRTTQGGMTTQPLLNMGAPVKMKRTPAKKSLVGNQDQLPANLQADILAAPGKMYDRSPGKMYDRSPAQISVGKKDEASQKAIREGLRDQKIDGYVNDSAFNDSNMDGTMASRAVKGLYRMGKRAVMRAGGPAGSAMANISQAKDNLQDKHDYNNNHYVKFKGDNPSLFTGNDDKKLPDGGGGKKPVNKKKVSYDTAYKNRDKKVYGGMDKAAYTKEAKRQNANFKKTGKWDVKSSYAKKAVAKPVNEIKPTGVTNKKVEITTKLDPKVIKKQVSKVNKTPKETSSRAAKLRAKGNAQLAAGDTKGAQRTRKKYDRKNAKVARKTKKGTNRVEYDESTGKGGSVLGNALRTVTGKRKRDKAAADRRKNAPGGSMI